jgi:methylthioribose-1-phosphate isomerase
MGKIKPISYNNGKLVLLDQRKLPLKTEYLSYTSPDGVYYAIKSMVVRGAPAIGVTAAYGMVLSANECQSDHCPDIIGKMVKDGNHLKKARPTAVNLAWAVDLMIKKAKELKKKDPVLFKWDLLAEAIKIHEADIDSNRAIGEYALGLLKEKRNILTHCNAGILATTEYGTATSVFYVGKEKGIDFHVFADETRPRLQGSRLTAYELMENGIEVTVISDSAAAHLMSKGEIEAVITGADRIAANGDTANKIGTLSVSINAKYFGIPMYIAAPLSTIDMSLETGDLIPIEERCRDEVVYRFGSCTAPEGVNVRNPAFDVTPAENITAIITDKGIVRPPFETNLKKLF